MLTSGPGCVGGHATRAFLRLKVLIGGDDRECMGLVLQRVWALTVMSFDMTRSEAERAELRAEALALTNSPDLNGGSVVTERDVKDTDQS